MVSITESGGFELSRKQMEFGAILRALQRSWYLPVLALLVGGAAAWGYSQLQTPKYMSTTQLFVSIGGTSALDPLQENQFSKERIASYANILTSEEMARRVIDQLQL